MRLNENTAILAPRVVLVPYESRHVERYHEWMKDAEIQDLTASEPLTLVEEYENQQSWRSSPDKLTFILCKALSGLDGEDPSTYPTVVQAGRADADGDMIGDINFFLYPADDDSNNDETEAQAPRDPPRCYGEIDVMIAARSNRARGLGFAAVTAFLSYIHRNLPSILAEYAAGNGLAAPPVFTAVVAKIKASNKRSAALFSRLGFVQRGDVNYFGEIELRLDDFGRFMAGEKGDWVGRSLREMVEAEYVRETE